MKYRIILNASVIVMGGGIQACVSFIRESLELAEDVEWIYFISPQINQELERYDLELNKDKVVVFEQSPSRSNKVRKDIQELVNKFKADAVFTFFGPAYVRFKIPHMCGVADGWVTHSTRLAYSALPSIKDKIALFLLCVYKGYWYRFADRWVVEAECAKKGLAARMGVKPDSVFIVKNSCAKHYIAESHNAFRFENEAALKILTLSSYYPHKNLEIIPYIIIELKKLLSNVDFQFLITLKTDSSEEIKLLNLSRELGVEENLINIGPVSTYDGPSLYSGIDIVFLPSLLETFSANYPEAMAAEKPIVTTDLDFAHDVCKSAALYFEPKNAEAAAKKIHDLIIDPLLVKGLVEQGKSILKKLPTSKDKYYQYEKLLINMIQQ